MMSPHAVLTKYWRRIRLTWYWTGVLAHKMQGLSINLSVKKSVRTQYNPLYLAKTAVPNSKEKDIKVKLSKKLNKENSSNTGVTFGPNINVHFIFKDNNRSQPGDSFDEKDEDSDVLSVGNDPPYCPDDETESDTSCCESINSDEFHSFNNSTVKEPKFLAFWSCPLPLLRFYLICS